MKFSRTRIHRGKIRFNTVETSTTFTSKSELMLIVSVAEFKSWTAFTYRSKRSFDLWNVFIFQLSIILVFVEWVNSNEKLGDRLGRAIGEGKPLSSEDLSSGLSWKILKHFLPVFTPQFDTEKRKSQSSFADSTREIGNVPTLVRNKFYFFSPLPQHGCKFSSVPSCQKWREDEIC